MANGTWKIARGKSGLQLPLILAVAAAVLLLLASRANLIPFGRARTAITDWAAPGLAAMNAPVTAVTRWAGGVGHFFDVYSENLRLKERNARLLQWQSAAIALKAQAERYRRLLKAVPDASYPAITAKVIARSSRPFLETVVLNAGSQNGVKPGQAVVDARGTIGRIYLAGQRTSWVILLTDLNSRVPVAIEPGNMGAILAGNNTGAPMLEALPPGAKVKDGARVVTSGDAGLLPPGLPVGLAANRAGGPIVIPFADAMTAGAVRILGFASPIEKMPTPSANDLPAFHPVPKPNAARTVQPTPGASTPKNAVAPAATEFASKHRKPASAPKRIIASPVTGAVSPATAPATSPAPPVETGTPATAPAEPPVETGAPAAPQQPQSSPPEDAQDND